MNESCNPEPEPNRNEDWWERLDESCDSEPDKLVIEAGGVYENANGSVWSVRKCLMATSDLDSNCVEVREDGIFPGDCYIPLVRPHTPAPKVYRMADESLLPGWTICYAMDEDGHWLWYSAEIESWAHKWRHKGTAVSNLFGTIPPEHAPQNLPDDFDWRDSLVMVEGKGC